MNRSHHDESLYLEANDLYTALRQPGTGRISDAAEIQGSPDGRSAVFAGTLMDRLEGSPDTRICHLDLNSNDLRVLTFGPNSDRLPKYSPDGQHIAFLSDRHKRGDFQLHLLGVADGAARATAWVDGWVEYFHWSPDGHRILLGVAGHGADRSGGEGAEMTAKVGERAPSWAPEVEVGSEAFRWRRAWIYELATNSVSEVSGIKCNAWEATWCGNRAIAVVGSAGPEEGHWYSAALCLFDLEHCGIRELYKPATQLGALACSPCGKFVAVVEGICSDRRVVAGEMLIIETASGEVRVASSEAVDICYIEWRSLSQLLVAGHRRSETVVGSYDIAARKFTQVWAHDQITTGGTYVTISGLGEAPDCLIVAESYLLAPEIASIRGGGYRRIRSFDLSYAEQTKVIASAEHIEWPAPDGMLIEGWLLLPVRKGPHPVVMVVHGGPVWQWRPVWLGRRSAWVLMLLRRGYAIFFPNPRGSSGRGQSFTRQVLGDMGGADTYDFLSGLDHLTQRGIADPKRLGVTGGSYGGFMTCWLITQDDRFAAAVPVAPMTNHVTGCLISNIPEFVSLFLSDVYTDATGKYWSRSPIMHAHKVRTPTLNICGALDRCTPPEEARQFHNALRASGVKSALVTYPEEGHGIRKFPAMIDYAVRIVSWFDEHMRA